MEGSITDLPLKLKPFFSFCLLQKVRTQHSEYQYYLLRIKHRQWQVLDYTLKPSSIYINMEHEPCCMVWKHRKA